MNSGRSWQLLLLGLAIGTGWAPDTGAVDYFVATNGNNAANGQSTNTPWRTLNYAFNAPVLQGGDHIYVRGGDYRESVAITHSVNSTNYLYIEAYSNETPVIKGSDVVTGWTPYSNAVWRVPWPEVTQQVFADGTLLQQIGWPSEYLRTNAWMLAYPPTLGTTLNDLFPGSFFYDTDSAVLYAWLPNSVAPTNHLMEVSTRGWCFNSQAANTRVWMKRFHFRHSSSIYQGPGFGAGTLVSVGLHGILEGGDIQWGDFCGVGAASNSKYLRCNISNNGNTGCGANTSTNYVFDQCTIFSNNYRRWSPGWHCGGMKNIPDCSGIVENSEVAYTIAGPGIWFDGCREGGPITIRNNYIHDNDGPGIFIEISNDARVYNNLIVSNVWSGISVNQSSGSVAYNNTIVGTRVYAGIQTSGGPRIKNFDRLEYEVLASNRFFNNLLVDNPVGLGLPINDPHSMDNFADNNLYYRSDGNYRWDSDIGVFTSLTDWQQATGCESNSLVGDPLLRVAAGDYLLTSNSPCIDRGTNMVGLTADYLNWPRPFDGNGDGTNTVDIGAYEYQGDTNAAFWMPFEDPVAGTANLVVYDPATNALGTAQPYGANSASYATNSTPFSAGWARDLPADAGNYPDQGPGLLLPGLAPGLQLTRKHDELTLGMWMWCHGWDTQTNRCQGLANNGAGPGGTNGWSFGLWDTADSTNAHSDSGQLYLQAGTPGGPRTRLSGTALTVPMGAWTHVAVNWTVGVENPRFWINGQSAGSAGDELATVHCVPASADLVLALHDAQTLPGHAILDDVQGVNRALSQAEMAYLPGLPVADLALTNRVDTPLVGAGDNVTFTVTVTNQGPAAATGVTVTDPLPAGLVYISHGGGSYNPVPGLWTIGTLNAGSSTSLTITVTVSTQGGYLPTAEVAACDQPDPDSTPGNGQAGEDDQCAATVGAVATTPNFVWTGAGELDANWTTATNWNPAGVPGFGDTVLFTGSSWRTVTIPGSRAAWMASADQSGNWTWSGAGALNIGSGFTYGSSDANSAFDAILEGPGSLTLTAGGLRLSNPANSFSGGIHVKGGTLAAARTGVTGVLNTLGDPTKTLTIGDASNTADAALELYGGNDAIYAQPIVIAAGSNRSASLIGSAHDTAENSIGKKLTGGVTLQRDLAVVNNALRTDYSDRRILNISGNITGSGSLSKDGIGIVEFNGSNTYVGATTVKNGFLNISGGDQTFTGDLHVDGGMLGAVDDSRLGDPGNDLTLGSPGRAGIFTLARGDLTTSRAITLNGNGGVLAGTQYSFHLNGAIGGAGPLIQAAGGYSWETQLNAANSYSGGTRVVWGRLFARNNVPALGTGNVRLDNDALLVISGVNSVHSSATVRVSSFSPDNSQGFGTVAYFGMPADIATVPAITTNSSGMLGFYGTSGAAVNTLLAGPVGNGYMFIGANCNSDHAGQDFVFTGTNLAIGAGDTYRFAPRNAITLANSVLVDPSVSTPAHVICGSLADAAGGAVGNSLVSQAIQTFSGSLFINRSTYQANALPGGSSLGSNAPIVLAAGTLYLNGNGVIGAAPLTNSNLTHEAHSKVELNEAGGDGIALTVASLDRRNNGCLQIWADQNAGAGLGTLDKLIVADPPASVNGMVAPHLTVWSWANSGNPDFADYAAPNGFTNVTYTAGGTPGVVTTQAGFDATVAADLVKVTGTDVSLSAPRTLYAVKTDSQLVSSGPQTFTLTGGGLILTGSGKTHSVNVSTPGELVVTVDNGNVANATRNTIAGSIAAAGLTKTGRGTLVLGADNSGTLTGDVTVDQGSLEIVNDNQLGASTNRIILNNADGTWTDGLRLLGGVTLPASRTIVLGANGGQFYSESGNATINGRITGTGGLNLWSASGFVLTNPSNDYSGGTYGPGSLTLQNGAQIGSGPIYICSWVQINDDAYRPNRFILSSDPRGPGLHFASSSPNVGSIEGGQSYGGGSGIFLDGWPTLLTVGGNDASTEYYGGIVEANDGQGVNGGCGIIKTGAGTFTTWGPNTYSGPTLVSNGTLAVNNWINEESVITVYPGATLKGLGTVGAVRNLGGTVRGSLHMQSLYLDPSATVAVTLNGSNVVSQYDSLHVVNGIDLNHSSLSIDLGYAPATEQTFTVISSQGDITGQFATGAVITAVYNGVTNLFTIDYGESNVVLTTVTELPKRELVVASDYGAPTPPVGSHLFDFGDTVIGQVAGSPAAMGTTQYVCTGWTGTGDVPASGLDTNTGPFLITKPSSLTWNWMTNYWLTTATDGHGYVDVGSDWQVLNSEVTVTATAHDDYRFGYWSGDTNGCTTNATQITVPMNRPRVLTAHFLVTNPPHPIPYTDSFESYSAGYRLIGTNGWSCHDTDAVVIAATNYTYSGLYPLVTGHTNVATMIEPAVTNRVSGPGDQVVWADFMYNATYWHLPDPVLADDIQWAVRLGSNGLLCLWHRDVEVGSNVWTELQHPPVDEGEWFRLSAKVDYQTPDSVHGCRYAQFLLRGLLLTNATAYTSNDGTGSAGGSWFALASTGTPQTVSGVAFSGKGALDDYTVTTNSPILHTITATAGPHGSIAPSGTVFVAHDATADFVITADPDYHVSDVLLDSLSIGATSACSFTNIAADHTVTAVFAPYPVGAGTLFRFR